jgi:hypothetical protein
MRITHHVVATIAVTLAVMIAPIGRLSGVAAADDKVPLGGGAGIVVNGNAYCTLGTIGHDNTGELVGFTAAHCGGPGSQVAAEGAEHHGPVGTVVAVGDGLDYSVIRFDPVKVTPIANFAGFAINGIGPDPGFLQPACTQGGATGYGCGSITVPGAKPATLAANMPAWQPGDDGAPVTVDGQLVGMTSKGRTGADLATAGVAARLTVTLLSAILNDTKAKGGPGAGFTPVPA